MYSGKTLNEKTGFRPAVVVKWMSNFHSNTYQSVVMKSHESFLLLVSSGVPQVPVLGPALSWFMSMNDIGKYLKF